MHYSILGNKLQSKQQDELDHYLHQQHELAADAELCAKATKVAGSCTTTAGLVYEAGAQFAASGAAKAAAKQGFWWFARALPVALTTVPLAMTGVGIVATVACAGAWLGTMCQEDLARQR